ncbi:DUF1178 family protein [Kozakia baliensis]|uniref:DUF1178 family protein n=1 Tax=Kozakia baliensis TaxID=153496 RepID=UPI00345C25A5
MIHYRLRCIGQHHEFEGWFKNAEAFTQQMEAGQLLCPHCGGQDIEKALMAPAIARKREDVPAPAPAAAMPDDVRTALQKIRAVVEAHCDDVGTNFAAEALKRHHADMESAPPTRGIYGVMQPDEREMLEDEGVDFAMMPWIGRADA